MKMTVAIHCGTVLGRVRASYAGFFFILLLMCMLELIYFTSLEINCYINFQ